MYDGGSGAAVAKPVLYIEQKSEKRIAGRADQISGIIYRKKLLAPIISIANGLLNY